MRTLSCEIAAVSPRTASLTAPSEPEEPKRASGSPKRCVSAGDADGGNASCQDGAP